MRKTAKATVVFLVLAAASWAALLSGHVLDEFFDDIMFVCLYGALIFSILFIGFACICISEFAGKRKNKEPSPYRPYKVFAIADLCIIAPTVAYAVYDILEDTGWFSGLLGTLILIFAVPVMLLILAVDLVLMWRAKRKAARGEKLE